ncbi:MAG: NADH-quinone oxidoreductase subunit L [Rickettsiales bacterium]|jgi:NADH-quinone oxidoreductase subunit L|nr:NADH-quinone oxidoreductase subunit L [Rickettsiales bacterium]
MNSILILTLPLISCFVASLFAIKDNKKLIHYICSSLLLFAAVLAFIDFVTLANGKLEYQNIVLFKWIALADLDLFWHIKRDSLTVMMNLVVTTVSAVVHFYSIGYMYDDKRVNRFMAYLSLFTFFMLLLVASETIIQLFVGWEGVGVCSYLLIGFWYKKESANAAAMKAFIVNRVGDFAFLIGIIGLYNLFGTTSLETIFSMAELKSNEMITFFGYSFKYLDFICIMLFIGCMGKSAQLGLHTWLPDAMEGPTPVSALIHAATMVTAGVFLIVRCSPLYELSQVSLDMITLVGALTCLFAATVAVVQNDIKKVIAYSTCSQLGYMFFACGVSAYHAGIFHLFTHAFFKALLFLVAGNIIVALHHQQDIRKMGALWKKLPITYLMFLVGTIAISGIPPFAGFFSKELILESAYISDGRFSNFAYVIGSFVAMLTAFYSFRLFFVVFHGDNNQEHPNDPLVKINNIVFIPLLILVLGSIFSGYFVYHNFDIAYNLEAFAGNIVMNESDEYFEKLHHIPAFFKLLPLILSFVGALAAFVIYFMRRDSVVKSFISGSPRIYKFLVNKWYFDEFYHLIFIAPYKSLSRFMWQDIDIKVIDNFGPNGFASTSRWMASHLIGLQNGYIYRYAFVMIVGVVLLTGYLYI